MTTSLGFAWFRPPRPSPTGWRRVVCFPHAGGGASFFRSWQARLPPSVDLLAVQYPGREDRLREPAIEDMDTLADRIAEAAGGLPDGPFALFGHSLGAAVAYEVALRVQHRAGSRLRGLVVSGQVGPGHVVPGTKHLAPDDVLWEELARLNGTDPGLAGHPELRPLLLPTLRSDYRLAERYRPRLPASLDCAVVACVGTEDPEVTPEQAAAWAEVAAGRFELRTFAGGDHFYLRRHREELLAIALDVLGVGPAEAAWWPSTP